MISCFNGRCYTGAVRFGAGEGSSARRRYHRIHRRPGVYAYTHRRLRELAGCDRGQVGESGGERFFVSHPAPVHHNTALYYAAIAAAWRNTTPCCGSPGTSHPKSKSDTAALKEARRSSSWPDRSQGRRALFRVPPSAGAPQHRVCCVALTARPSHAGQSQLDTPCCDAPALSHPQERYNGFKR